MRTYTEANPCPTQPKHDAQWMDYLASELQANAHQIHRVAPLLAAEARAYAVELTSSLPKRPEIDSKDYPSADTDETKRIKATSWHLHALANRLDTYAARAARAS